MQNERKVLVSAILKAEKNGFSNIILNSILNETDLDNIKKSFVTAAFYGVLERKLTLEYILNKFLKKTVSKAPPYTVAVLKTAAYQILFMKKIPTSAAVNEAVKLMKKSKEKGNSGLVNAVLRKVAEEGKALLTSINTPEIKYSVSPWIYTKLSKQYSEDKAIAFLENSLNSPPVFIKINILKENTDKILQLLSGEGIELENTEIENCYLAKGINNIEKTSAYKEGLIFVQDFSSAFCVEALKVKSGMRVLDCCAAPGGKTFSLALHMKNEGEIVSSDIHSHRVNLVEKGANRLGLSIVKPKTNDATVFDESLGEFDRVLCDVPCSGIGVIRRKPEIKYKALEECAALPELQLKILTNASKYLKKGGRLIYSTCTLLKEENEEVVSRFLKDNTDFRSVSIDLLDIDGHCHTFIPPDSLGDGFFVAVLERK